MKKDVPVIQRELLPQVIASKHTDFAQAAQDQRFMLEKAERPLFVLPRGKANADHPEKVNIGFVDWLSTVVFDVE